jgi:DNA polymerase-3 subunit alpha
VPFSDYAFNKAHTAGYGLVSYWTAYLKANYPVEYMASVLTSVNGEKDKTAVYLSECRRMGIKVLPPDVNLSDPEFTASGDEIRFGLSSVRNVGETAVAAIIATREDGGRFASFGDFLRRVPGAARNRKVVDSLIKGGAFGSLGHTRRGLAEAADEALALSAGARGVPGQVSLFEALDGEQDAPGEREAVVPEGEWSKHELLTHEREMLGLYVSDHPLSGCEGTLARIADCTVASIHGPDGRADGAEVTLAGIISVLERKVTKKGKPWATATVEDTTGGIEALFFPSTYDLVTDLLGKDRAVAVRGRINRRDETPVLFASDVTPIDLGEPGGAVRLYVESSRCTPLVVTRLAEILADHPGESPVLLAVRTGASSRTLARPAACAPSPDLFARVRALLGPASC